MPICATSDRGRLLLRRRHYPVRRAWLTGASVVALILAAPRDAEAGALGRSGVAGGAPIITSNAMAAAAQQAAAIAKQSQGALLRATQAIQAMQAAQNAARKLASTGQQLPNVTDGLSAGGLVVDPRVPKDLSNPQPGEDPTFWQNAKLPTQTAGNGQTIVTINQTAPQALLNWTTFNVGKNTIVDFNQQRNANWVALNKINDPSGLPSQILGQIKADGQVYLINRNGIIFGGSSQVNVGTLVASALPINDALVNAGTLYSNLDSQFTFSAYMQPGGTTGPTAAFNPDAATAATQDSKVVVQPGAVIQTPLSPTNSGGRVILIGPEVANNGKILTPDGQTILAAGQQVALVPHLPKDPALLPKGTTDPQASVRGLDVFIGSVQAPAIGGQHRDGGGDGACALFSGQRLRCRGLHGSKRPDICPERAGRIKYRGPDLSRQRRLDRRFRLGQCPGAGDPEHPRRAIARRPARRFAAATEQCAARQDHLRRHPPERHQR